MHLFPHDRADAVGTDHHIASHALAVYQRQHDAIRVLGIWCDGGVEVDGSWLRFLRAVCENRLQIGAVDVNVRCGETVLVPLAQRDRTDHFSTIEKAELGSLGTNSNLFQLVLDTEEMQNTAGICADLNADPVCINRPAAVKSSRPVPATGNLIVCDKTFPLIYS